MNPQGLLQKKEYKCEILREQTNQSQHRKPKAVQPHESEDIPHFII